MSPLPAPRLPEVEVLICCARTQMDAENACRLKTLMQHNMDWDKLIRLAQCHRLIPLLYRNLKATYPEAVPQAVLHQLRAHCRAIAPRNLFLTKELLNLLKRLDAHGIAAIPYKGPALAVALYGSLSLRQFADLDLLVRKRDVRNVKTLLMQQGYQPQHVLSAMQETAFLQSQCEYTFCRANPTVHVDVHWQIVAKSFAFNIDLEHLWNHLEPMSLGDTTVRSFPPDALLLILCVHAAKHCWQQLNWLCDIAELIRVHPQLNWERVLEQSATLGGERMLLLGLALTALLGVALPPKVRQRIRTDPTVQTLADEVCERLLRGIEDESSTWEGLRFHIRARERLRDRARYGFHWLTMPTVQDWRFLELPPRLASLYYLLRPMRQAGTYGLGLFHLVKIIAYGK